MSLTKVRVWLGSASLVGLILAAILFLYVMSPYVEHGVVPGFHSTSKDTVIFGATGVSCLFVCARLMAKRRWAWWVVIISTSLLGTVLLEPFWLTGFPLTGLC